MSEQDPRPYKILSLDGGGTWALIQVRALQTLFGDKARGHDVASHFDLIAANSGGSIVAACLFMNLKLHHIRLLFESEERRTSIFSPRWTNRGLLKGSGVPPRYKAAKKPQGLISALSNAASFQADTLDLFKDEPMHKAWQKWKEKTETLLPHFLVLAFDFERDRALYFRTNEKSLAGTGGFPGKVAYHPTMLHAVHASTNAPVIYFDNPAEIKRATKMKDEKKQKMRTWDGAIAGYNNPLVAAVTEALANGEERSQIRVLSIGTAADKRPIKEDFWGKDSFSDEEMRLIKETPNDGPLRDVKKLATSILKDPPDVASYTAHIMLGGTVPGLAKDVGKKYWPVVRMNPLVAPIMEKSGDTITLTPPRYLDEPPEQGRSALDYFEEIAELDMDATAKDDVDLINRLCAAWLKNGVLNQPVMGTGPGGQTVHIGDRTFDAAHNRAWDLGLCTKEPN